MREHTSLLSVGKDVVSLMVVNRSLDTSHLLICFKLKRDVQPDDIGCTILHLGVAGHAGLYVVVHQNKKLRFQYRNYAEVLSLPIYQKRRVRPR